MLKFLERIFVKKQTSIIGLDIGTDNVKLAELSLTGNQPELLTAGILPLSPGSMQDGRIIDSEAVTEQVRQLIAMSGAKAQNAVVGIGGRAMFVREVLFPVLEEAELGEAIKWDMEKYVPYEPDSFYYDYAIVGKAEKETEMKVLLAAAPHDVINALVAVVKDAGLRPVAIELEPLALCRILELPAEAMVIDIGGKFSQVSIFRDGQLSVTRTIPIGGQSFTDTIMRNLGVDSKEAEYMKQHQPDLLQLPYGMSEQTDLHRELELAVRDLTREVRRTAEYYQMKNRGAVIDTVILTGGGMKLDNLMEHFAAQIDLPVTVHQQPVDFSVAAGFDRKYIEDLFPQLAVAIGLAIRGGERPS